MRIIRTLVKTSNAKKPQQKHYDFSLQTVHEGVDGGEKRVEKATCHEGDFYC